MSVRPWRDIQRKKTKGIKVGNVEVGGDAPISVQSMTNTLTTDIEATVEQVRGLEDAGADLVRISCPDEDSTTALKSIIKKVNVPIIADIHFHYKRAIEAADAGAACLRINPGNIGSLDRIKEVIHAAKNNNCSIRIGVNAGSLERKILDKYKIEKTSRTGYSIGIGYPPDWGEHTLNISKGDKTLLEPNVTFHMIAVMQFGNWGVEASEAIRVTDKGSELFCNFSRELHVKS